MKPSFPIVQVIILADASLVRLAWEALLNQQPVLAVWGTAVNPADVCALPLTSSQTAVLLDSRQLSLQELAQLAEAMPDYGLLCLVDDYDLDQIVAFLQAGATGILIRDVALPELNCALVATGRREIVLPSSLATRILAALVRGEVYSQDHVETLTQRESEVLALLAQGQTNKDIAQSLFLSVRTIEGHLRHIYSKLGVASRTEAVLWAVEHKV